MVSQLACTSGVLGLGASPGQSRQAWGWRFGAPAPLALAFNWRFPLYKPSNCPLVGPIRGTRTSRCWRPGAVIKLRPGDCARRSVLSVPVLAVVEVGKRCNKEQCLWYFGISSVTCLHPGVSLHVCVQAWCHVGWQISRGVGIRKQALYCYRGCSLRAITSLGSCFVSLVLCEAVFVIPFVILLFSLIRYTFKPVLFLLSLISNL